MRECGIIFTVTGIICLFAGAVEAGFLASFFGVIMWAVATKEAK